MIDVNALAEALRLERGDDGEWWVPAEPGPLGPFDIVTAAKNFVELIDEEDAKNRAALSEYQGLVKEMAQEIRGFMAHLEDYCGHKTGDPYEGDDCPHEFVGLTRCKRIQELLNRPSIQQLLHEGR